MIAKWADAGRARGEPRDIRHAKHYGRRHVLMHREPDVVPSSSTKEVLVKGQRAATVWREWKVCRIAFRSRGIAMCRRSK